MNGCKLEIKKKLEDNIGKKVILTMKKKDRDNSFTREVTILKVFSDTVIAKGLSGMEWPYVIDDGEMEMLKVEVCNDKN